jgi:hypothetical protein
MNIYSMRGRAQHEAMVRAYAVVSGQNTLERSPYVLSIAADIVLADSLKAKNRNHKHGILSHRQFSRRRQREVYVSSGVPDTSAQYASRGARNRHATSPTREELGFDGAF